MFPARLLTLLPLAVVLLTAGCGSSDGQDPTATATTPAAPPGASARSCQGTAPGTSDLRVTGVECDVGREVAAAWVGKPDCAPQDGASRASCAPQGAYRCLGAATDQGVAVSCAQSGSSIAFVARRDENLE
jgi:hypothetical protein